MLSSKKTGNKKILVKGSMKEFEFHKSLIRDSVLRRIENEVTDQFLAVK